MFINHKETPGRTDSWHTATKSKMMNPSARGEGDAALKKGIENCHEVDFEPIDFDDIDFDNADNFFFENNFFIDAADGTNVPTLAADSTTDDTVAEGDHTTRRHNDGGYDDTAGNLLLAPFAFCGCGSDSANDLERRRQRAHFLQAFQEGTFLTDIEVDRVWKKGLDRLSEKEREGYIKLEKGIGHGITESEELITESFEELEYELVQISHNTAYQRALQDNPSYVKDTRLRLAFLRADNFDARKGARRMIRFLEEKLRLFGPHCLTRNITLDDLTDDDKIVLNSGNLQASSGKDRCGRHVYFCTPKLRPVGSGIESICKVHFYQAQQLFLDAENEDIQRRGIVGVFYVVGLSATDLWGTYERRHEAWLLNRVSTAMPLRICQSHVCYDDPRLRILLGSTVLSLLSKQRRASLKLHVGTHVEALYSLMEHGIPAKSIPVSTFGIANKVNYQKWIEKEISKDQRQTQNHSDESSSYSVLHQVPAIEALSSHGMEIDIPERRFVSTFADSVDAGPIEMSSSDTCPRGQNSANMQQNEQHAVQVPGYHDVVRAGLNLCLIL